MISSLCGHRVEAALAGEFARAKMIDSSGRDKTVPRLEWVLEHAFRVAGAEAMRALEVLKTPGYNDIHRTLAAHLAQPGAEHVTVNVDACIENAAAAEDLTGVQPIHLHGCVAGAEEPVVRTGQLRVVELDQRLAHSPNPEAIGRALLEARWVDRSLSLLDGVTPAGHRLSMRASDLQLRGNRW